MEDLVKNVAFESIFIPDITEFKLLDAKKISDIPWRQKTIHLSLDSKMGDDYEEKSESAKEFG